jgi:hypothetical protein
VQKQNLKHPLHFISVQKPENPMKRPIEEKCLAGTIDMTQNRAETHYRFKAHYQLALASVAPITNQRTTPVGLRTFEA